MSYGFLKILISEAEVKMEAKVKIEVRFKKYPYGWGHRAGLSNKYLNLELDDPSKVVIFKSPDPVKS